MRYLKLIISSIFSICILILLQFPIGSIPALGPLFDPLKGFMASAESNNPQSYTLQNESLSAPVQVYFDNRMVPHIFAQNEADLFFAQGYVTASMRLWQMEMTAMASAGTLSEKLGPDFLQYDRLQRRLGMLQSAELALQTIDRNDASWKALESYGQGVNAFIKQLKPADYPLEYKLMDFDPEPWTALNTFLLLKYMSNTLTGFDDDVAFSNLQQVLSSEHFNLLYPERYLHEDPIIPAGKYFSNNPADTFLINLTSSQISLPSGFKLSSNQGGVGSNNWAVSGTKTQSGKPILCNDPHLPLNLPSLWFEIQLSAPGINTYGVSLPGSPCVIIGFNEQVAWGVTNAGRDVRDWYALTLDKHNQNTYYYDGEWLPLNQRVDTIRIKGKEPYLDTIRSSHHGPLVYKDYPEADSIWSRLAMKWLAHQPSNELKTFYLLNKAENYAAYRKAISTFSCPAQNFVYADRHGDIAITQSGSLARKWQGQGRTILDGSKIENEWGSNIPWEEYPHDRNPERGFVSSANQHPTNADYPYYYTGFDFEHYRNRRINKQLSELEDIDIYKMQQLQLDNFHLLASECLPAMLESISAKYQQHNYYNSLQEWDYYNEADLTAPTLFELWWQAYEEMAWDELVLSTDWVMPKPAITANSLTWDPNHILFDIKSTSHTENRNDLIEKAFVKTIQQADSLRQINPELLDWYRYKNTSIMHLASLPAFSRESVHIGGNKHIVNATSAKNGPSWRMVVQLGDWPEAYAIYPGGQSGNPGHAQYDSFINDWAEGNYYKLSFFRNETEAKESIQGNLIRINI